MRRPFSVAQPWVGFGVPALVLLLSFPQEGRGQAPPAASPPVARADSVELLFEREVFRYPRGNRRNPFLPLTGEDAGPRVEDLLLSGVILSEAPGGSIALLRTRAPARPSAREGTATPAPSLRVREGDRLGSLRILSIEQRRVLVEVDEFGVREIRVLELRRPGVEAEENLESPPPSPPAPAPEAGGEGVAPDTIPIPGTNPFRDQRDGDKV